MHGSGTVQVETSNLEKAPTDPEATPLAPLNPALPPGNEGNEGTFGLTQRQAQQPSTSTYISSSRLQPFFAFFLWHPLPTQTTQIDLCVCVCVCAHAWYQQDVVHMCIHVM